MGQGWGRAGAGLAAEAVWPVDLAVTGYDIFSALPDNSPQPQFVTPMARPIERHLRNPGEGNL